LGVLVAAGASPAGSQSVPSPSPSSSQTALQCPDRAFFAEKPGYAPAAGSEQALLDAFLAEEVAAQAAPLPSPLRVIAAKLECGVPFADARIDKVAQPTYPEIAKIEGATGSVQVQVDLDAAGHVIKAFVSHSSGNDPLDGAALQAALATTYNAAVIACKPQPGAFIFRANFTKY